MLHASPPPHVPAYVAEAYRRSIVTVTFAIHDNGNGTATPSYSARGNDFFIVDKTTGKRYRVDPSLDLGKRTYTIKIVPQRQPHAQPD